MAESIRFQYAVYFLPRHVNDPSAVLRQLLAKKYSQLKLIAELPTKPREMLVQAFLEKDVPHQYAPPDLKALEYFGHGLTPKQGQALQKSGEAFILDFGHPKENAWSALRNADELIEEIARKTGGLVWDDETREVFSPDAWHKKRLASWTDPIPDISSQMVIHSYQSDEYVREITLGMSKAGLPDVVVDNSRWSSSDQIGNLINLFSQAMAEGATFHQSGKFKLDMRAIKNAKVRETQLKSVKPNSLGMACLSLKPGVWEEGDPKNRLLRLDFDSYAGADDHAQQNSMINTLFGSEDAVQTIRHSEELLAASRKARARLPDLQKAFLAGLQPAEYIQVKAPFPTAEGNREWMWVEVTSWKGDKIKGPLANDPFEIPSMHAGQIVEVREEDVFDYLRRYPDGHEEGNTTGEIIKKMEQEKSPSRPVDVAKPVVPECGNE
jgi:uncharacterized protein YegJ (DUF2314 family)